MPDFNYQKQAQDYYGNAPVIILGSGASAAHGMSGMGALATHLIAHTDTTRLSASELDTWNEFCRVLENGTDLESALQKIDISQPLTLEIIKTTWGLINSEDILVFQRLLQNEKIFPLSLLLEHMFKSSLKIINIITTNYDRLAEYACDQKGLHHHSGFQYGYLRHQASPTEITFERRVNIWKVHGSIDWFQSPLNYTVSIPNTQSIPNSYEPLIVTPGTQKYHKTHLEPFRSIISNADEAINGAKSYLCIGYGFNDEHIQPKLMTKCQRLSTPITLITRSLSDSAKSLILAGAVQNYLAIERGNSGDQSIVYSSLDKTPLVVEKNIWSLEGYLSLIM